ncbi:MAG TPA: D-glycerate dehydrogenase [Gemmataceae bacterium]|jgi:glyoxylate reductase|nr:D-glycerate dehydrogenase [Gemmataceae bacterium]
MAVKPRVFVTRVIPAAGLERIKQHCAAEVWADPLPPPHAVLRQKVADCEGLVSLLTDRVDAALLDAAPRLRVVSNYAVGFNNIDVPAATGRGIAIGNTPGVLTDATADMAFCLLIAAARRVVEGHQYTRAGKWKTWEPLGHLGQDLAGRTLGIVGMGRIGHALAKRCHGGWDMNVLYHDVRRHEQAEKELGARQVDFDTLLRESDFVSVHTDLNEKTRGLFGAAQFQKMKPTAVFVNTARGPLVDQKALYQALRSGTIFAAGLDVTDPEPPTADDPLLQLSNVILAPHIASATVGTRNAMAEICADNLIAGLSGQDLRCWVNPEVAVKRRKA